MIDRQIYAGQIITHLSRAMSQGSRDLADVPGLLVRVIDDGMWREWTEPSGRHWGPFRSFEHWMLTPASQGGLGSNEKQLRGLCQDNTEAQDALDKALKRPPGGDRRSEQVRINVDNINSDVRPDGTSRSAALRRLRKDRPDLHAKVLKNELSPHAAMVKAGFRRRTFTVPADDPQRIAATLRRRLDPFILAEVARAIQPQKAP